MSIKALLKSDTARRFACWLGASYIRFVHASGRWRVVRGEAAQRKWRDGEPFIVSFWHGRLLMMPYCWRSAQPVSMLISSHRDGRVIARVIRHFNIAAIFGSTSRGGTRALRSMVKALKAGESIGVTPDGPRGPRMRASDGVITLARLSGAPILPAAYSAARGRVLGSWDRFLLALPFSRGVIVWGEPVHVARNADRGALEDARRRLEDRMNAITEEADRLVGRQPVSPAAPVIGQASA